MNATDNPNSSSPKLLARAPDSPDGSPEVEELAKTCQLARASARFLGGHAVVELFESERSGDPNGQFGGIVLRLTLGHEGGLDPEHNDPPLIPLVRSVENGVELHLAGDDEAGALLALLRLALEQVDLRRLRRWALVKDLKLTVPDWISDATETTREIVSRNSKTYK